MMSRHLVDNDTCMNEGKDQQTYTRKMFHSQERFFAKLPMPKRDKPTQANKPHADAQRNAGNTRQLAGPVGGHPFVRDEVRSENDPKSQHAHIAHHANKPGHKGGARMKPLLDIGFEFVSVRPEIHRHLHHRFDHEKFYPQKKHEDKAEEFHGRLNISALEKGG